MSYIKPNLFLHLLRISPAQRNGWPAHREGSMVTGSIKVLEADEGNEWDTHALFLNWIFWNNEKKATKKRWHEIQNGALPAVLLVVRACRSRHHPVPTGLCTWQLSVWLLYPHDDFCLFFFFFCFPFLSRIEIEEMEDGTDHESHPLSSPAAIAFNPTFYAITGGSPPATSVGKAKRKLKICRKSFY